MNSIYIKDFCNLLLLLFYYWREASRYTEGLATNIDRLEVRKIQIDLFVLEKVKLINGVFQEQKLIRCQSFCFQLRKLSVPHLLQGSSSKVH